MGLGKTEAALYAAYKLLFSGQASGIYFALPTQLTSNKIFERFNLFLQGDKKNGLSGILADDCHHRPCCYTEMPGCWIPIWAKR